MRYVLLILGCFSTLLGMVRAQGSSPLMVTKVLDHEVVRIVTVTGGGSGIVVTEDGLILTNYHVVRQPDGDANGVVDVYLGADGQVQQYSARLVEGDVGRDLALYAIEGSGSGMPASGPFRYLALGDYRAMDLQPEDQVTVWGYTSDAWGNTSSEELHHVALSGLVLASKLVESRGEVLGFVDPNDLNEKLDTLERNVTAADQLPEGDWWIATSADLAFGMSGGAVVDCAGVVVGLAHSRYTDPLTGEEVSIVRSMQQARDWLEERGIGLVSDRSSCATDGS